MSPAPFGLNGLRRATLGLALRHSDLLASQLRLSGRGDARFFDGALRAGLSTRPTQFSTLAFAWRTALFRVAGGAASIHHTFDWAVRLALLERLHFY